jgi:hypothetical protein
MGVNSERMASEFFRGFGDLRAHLAGRERCNAGERMGELFPAYEPMAAKVG